MNRYVFIIPFRNASKFIKQCADSILSQNYQNWIAIFCDDCSDDNSIGNIPNDSRFIINRNQIRLTALENIHNNIIYSDLQAEDIICLLDGDDFLIVPNVLDTLNVLYEPSNTLLSYGQYMYPNSIIGHCKAYTRASFELLRHGGYWASHLRTFKYKLYKEMIHQDNTLSCLKDTKGEFYKSCYDVAIMTPLMEIAGFDNIIFNPKPVYYYRIHENNDHFVNAELQKNIEIEIFSKPKFKQIF